MKVPTHDKRALRAPQPGRSTTGSSTPRILDILAHGRDLASALARDHDLPLDIAHDLARALARDLAHDRDLAGDDDLARARELDRTLARARELDRLLVHNRSYALVSARSSALAHARALAARLASDLAHSYECALGLDRVSSSGAAPGQQGTVVRVAPSARRLLAVAGWLLPAADRARYSEEYSSELWDIAHAGARRRHQFQYAIRQTLRLVQLRSAVLAPRRRSASP